MANVLNPRSDGTHSATVEDYLKAVYEICQRSETRVASTGDIAHDLRITPGSVSLMVRRLSDAGLLKYQPYDGCTLTADGLAIAKRVLQRHLTVEEFLTEVLGLDGKQVHDEAESLEHAVSDKLIIRMQRYLSHRKQAA